MPQFVDRIWSEDEPSKCVIFFTGGSGWNLEETMQKATAWWPLQLQKLGGTTPSFHCRSVVPSIGGPLGSQRCEKLVGWWKMTLIEIVRGSAIFRNMQCLDEPNLRPSISFHTS